MQLAPSQNQAFDSLQIPVENVCKVCNWAGKSLLQHLNKASKCDSEYSEKDKQNLQASVKVSENLKSFRKSEKFPKSDKFPKI